MKLAYDYQVFGMQTYGGISRYVCEVANRISARGLTQIRVVAPFYVNTYLRESRVLNVLGTYVPSIPRTRGVRQSVNAMSSQLLFRADPPDVVHETYYNARRLTPPRTRVVLTVHDMVQERLKNLFPLSEDMTAFHKAEAVKRADHIICVSENTRKDLMELLHVEPQRVTVVHHGCTAPVIERDSKPGPAQEPFILYVGLRAAYKNFHGLLEAYASSPAIRDNFRLVCFGGGPLSAREQNDMRRLKLAPGRVVHTAGDDGELSAMYEKAALFVYPSLYEGFGIPLLEAMARQCPVACSTGSCFPEVAQTAAEYFNPHSVESIRTAMENVLFSPTRREELKKAGLQRCGQFSWKRCAEQTEMVYGRLA